MSAPDIHLQPATNPDPVGFSTDLGSSLTHYAGTPLTLAASLTTVNAGVAGDKTTARFEWDFGDPTSPYNKMLGFNAAHIYDTTGAYTLRLRVTNEDNETSVKEVAVTVATNPNTGSGSNSKTIYVSGSGNDSTNNGLSTAAPFRTLERAMDELNMAGTNDGIKILFNRGDTYTVNSHPDSILRDDVYIGAYGAGNKPIIIGDRTLTDLRFFKIGDTTSAISNNVVIQDLEFTTDRPDLITNEHNFSTAIQIKHGENVAIRDCEFKDLYEAVKGEPNEANGYDPDGILVQNNYFPLTTGDAEDGPGQPDEAGARKNAIWISGNDWTILNNRLDGGVRKWSGHLPVSGGATGEGENAIRVDQGDNVAEHLNLSNNTVWNDGKGTIAIRGSVNYAYVHNNTLNNAFLKFGETWGTTDGNRTELNNIVADSNVITGTYAVLKGNANFVMYRNNYLHHTTSDASVAATGDTFQISQNVDYSINHVRYLNNTAQNDNDPTHNSLYAGPFLKINGAPLGSTLTDIVVANNLFIANADYANREIDMDSNYLSQTTVKNNVWWDTGGIIHEVGSNTKTITQWNSDTGNRPGGVDGPDADIVTNSVAVNSAFTPSSNVVNIGTRYKGALWDRNGNLRPDATTVSAGAVELNPWANGGIVASLEDGAGTSSSDQFAGTSGNGWVGAWTTSQSNATVTAALGTASPVASGGNYVDVKMDGGTLSADRLAGVGRGYQTANGVDTGASHRIEFDFRYDSSMATWDGSNDRVLLFGSNAVSAVTGPSNTWLAAAFGGNSNGLITDTWGFQDGDQAGGAGTFIDTGILLVPSRVYHFTINVDPTTKTYTGTIIDDVGNTFTSRTLRFRTSTSYTTSTNTYINFVTKVNSNSEASDFSVDSLRINGTQTIANFAGGTGTSSSDQYAGVAGNGWSTAWSANQFNATTSPSVVSTTPMNGSGNYLSTTVTGGATVNDKQGAVSRGYSTTRGGIDTGAKHRISFDVRLDSALTTFTDTDDRLVLFGDDVATHGTSGGNTWSIGAFGAATNGSAALKWAFLDGDQAGGTGTYTDTGVTLAVGTVYHMTVTNDPTTKTYTATITDGTPGAGHTYSSGELGWRTGDTFTTLTNTFINFGSRRNSNGEATTFSVDSVRIEAV